MPPAQLRCRTQIQIAEHLSGFITALNRPSSITKICDLRLEERQNLLAPSMARLEHGIALLRML